MLASVVDVPIPVRGLQLAEPADRMSASAITLLMALPRCNVAMAPGKPPSFAHDRVRLRLLTRSRRAGHRELGFSATWGPRARSVSIKRENTILNRGDRA